MENINKSQAFTYISLQNYVRAILKESIWKYHECIPFFLVHFWVIWTPILEARGLTKVILFSTHRYTDLTWIKDIHTHLKCNVVLFEIPKSFPYICSYSSTELHICDLKIDKITVPTPIETRGLYFFFFLGGCGLN